MCGGAGHVRGRAGGLDNAQLAGTGAPASSRWKRVLHNAQLAGTGAPASSRWKHVLHNARLPDNQLCWQVLCCEAV